MATIFVVFVWLNPVAWEKEIILKMNIESIKWQRNMLDKISVDRKWNILKLICKQTEMFA